MKSRFGQLLLSTVFAGVSFGCCTPLWAELKKTSPKEKGPVEVLAHPAPKVADGEIVFEAIGDIQTETKRGAGYYFYCSYIGGRGTARGTIGGYGPLEGVLRGACMACLHNGVKSCAFDGCTSIDYVTNRNAERTFDRQSRERKLEFDHNTVNLSCPIDLNSTRTDAKSKVAVTGEVGKGESLAVLVPTSGRSESVDRGDRSYHYESGGSFESGSNGYYREWEYNYDSRRGGGVSREIEIRPRSRFWGGYFGPGMPGSVVPRNKSEVERRGSVGGAGRTGNAKAQSELDDTI